MKCSPKKVTELEERMYAAQRSANVGNVVSHAALPNYLRFHGESKEQPYSFLTALENYFLVNGTPETMKLRFVEEALSSKAQYWWQALTPTPRSYEEWREILRALLEPASSVRVKISLDVGKVPEGKCRKHVRFRDAQSKCVQDL